MDSNSMRDLKKLSDQELLSRMDKLVSEERRISFLVLQHLREVEVRRLYVDLGFDSMYKYCIQHLKYSEGEAQRRLSSARLLQDLPEIEAKIKSGDLNITNLSAVRNFVRAEKLADKPLSREEKLELISNLENKSTRQVKQELIQQSHQPALLAEKFQMPAAVLPIPVTKFETFLTDENQDLLQEFKNLYAHDLTDHSNQTVLLFLLNKAVQHKKKKLGLIEKTPRTSNAPLPSAAHVNVKVDKSQVREETNTADSSSPEVEKHQKSERQRKAIPQSVQRKIWKRANACCEHVDMGLKSRCTSKFALEIDHVTPVALGGTNEPGNLRLLCRSHNSRRAVVTFGPQ